MSSKRGNLILHRVVVALLCAVSASPDRLIPINPSTAHAQAAEPKELPHVMRPGLRAAMSRHAEHAAGLTVSVALGAHDQTERHLDELLSELRPAAPSPDDLSTLNQQLPAKWFALDADFRRALGKLREAVQARKEERILKELGAVMRACRACHRELHRSPRR